MDRTNKTLLGFSVLLWFGYVGYLAYIEELKAALMHIIGLLVVIAICFVFAEKR